MNRGLLVIGSYKPKERDIEAHFYFPYESLEWVRIRIETSRMGKERVAGTFGRRLNRLLKGMTLQEWWDWTPKINVRGNKVPYVRLYKKTMDEEVGLRGSDFRDSRTLRFQYPKNVKEEKGIDVGERRNVWIPVPRMTEVMKSARNVLVNWLIRNDYMIPPLKKGGVDGNKSKLNADNSIGGELKKPLETSKLGEKEFALKIFDYDMMRIPKEANFEFDVDWNKYDDKISKVQRLAVRNTSGWSGFESKKKRTTQASVREF